MALVPGSSKEAAATGLFGPYLLSEYEINHNLVGGDNGVYALGFTGKDGVFYIDRVGRSEKNLVDTLKKYEGMYKEFKFKFYETERACFDKECELFHAFTPRDNIAHPKAPKGIRLKCPVCGL
ncbi:MAG: hypothetical protein HY562_07935 [Ignavibacteriales bacterium]|nr:hypothetical protein [Ignavibacteriales bacterium]